MLLSLKGFFLSVRCRIFKNTLQVKEGYNYELVITNPSCLYRYRFGDVVQVVGFHNECPIVEFKYRYVRDAALASVMSLILFCCVLSLSICSNNNNQ